jgi:uncharacterized protein YjaG (DUF416 family)
MTILTNKERFYKLMNKITKFENNIYRQENFDIYSIFPKINEILVKFYLVIRISNLKNINAFAYRCLN